MTLPFDEPQDAPDFDGETYNRKDDHIRLGAQALRVFNVVRDGAWRTLEEIKAETGDPEASISARLRDFRKPRFGEHDVERRHRGPAEEGLYEYRLVVNAQAPLPIAAGRRQAREEVETI